MNQRKGKLTIYWAILTALMLLFSACGGNTPQASSSTPIKLRNCGHNLTFTKVPSRVISTGQAATDILLALGLGDRIIGTYYKSLYQSEPRFTSGYKKIRDLGGNMVTSVPSKEVVLSARPDFVFSAYPAGDFLPAYGMATQEQLTAQGASVYGMSGECNLKATQARVTDLYTDILNLGTIFHVNNRAQQIVNDMRNRINTTQKRVSQFPLTPVVGMPMSANPGASGSINVIGGGMYTDVLRLAGAKNVFGTQAQTYPTISKEAFTKQKPDAYILVQYVGIDPARTTAYLYKTFPLLPASQKQRLVIVKANHWNAGIFLPDAIEQIAKALHPEAF